MPDQDEYQPYAEETPVEEAGEPTEANPETPVEEPEEAADPEAEEPEHAEEPVKKKTGSQRAREALQREREARLRVEAELASLKSGQKPVERPSGRPKAEDFETHEAFVEALTDFKVSQALVQRDQSTQNEKQRDRWEEQKEAVREKYRDFDEVFENAPAPGPLVAAALLKHKVGAEIAYYLGTHPAEYKRIDRLHDPLEVGFELAEIAGKLSASPGAKPTSKAPPPISPTRASVGAVKSEGGYEPY